MLTRRRFLRRSVEAGLVVMLPACKGGAAAMTVGAGDILVNHIGFAPASMGKFCMVAGNAGMPFSIVENGTDHAVFQGNLSPQAGDLGSFVIGDFSEFKQLGTYQIRAGNARSASWQSSPPIPMYVVQQPRQSDLKSADRGRVCLARGRVRRSST